MYLYSAFFIDNLEKMLKNGQIECGDGLELFTSTMDAYCSKVSMGNIPDVVYNSGIAVIEIDSDIVGSKIVDDCMGTGKIYGVYYGDICAGDCRVITHRGGRGNILRDVKKIAGYR